MLAWNEEQIGRRDHSNGLFYSGIPLIIVATISLMMWALAWSDGRPDAMGLLYSLIFFGGIGGAIAHEFLYYRSFLKEVWLGEHGLRVCDQRGEFFVPYRAIDTVSQKWCNRTLYIVVQVRDRNAREGRFTFLPIRSSIWNENWAYFGGMHAVVTRLNDRIAGAQVPSGKKPLGPSAMPARSILADDDLDGPSS